MIKSELSSKQTRTFRVIILLLAALSRVAVAFYLGDHAGAYPVHDQDSYDILAQRVLAGKGLSFPVSWYPWVPADTQTSYYSSTMVLYLAGIYRVFGHHPLAARLVTALIGTYSCYLVFLLGKRLFSPRIGLLAALLMSGYAYLVYFSAALMTETLFIAALLAALDITLKLIDESKPRLWLLLGISLAICVLLRMAVLPFVVLLLAWIYFRSPSRPSLYLVCIPALIIVLAVLPWTVRNYRLYGRFMLLESQFGHVFWNGNHPDRGTSFEFGNAAWVAPLPQDIQHLNEAEKTYELLRRGVRNVLADPVRFVRLSLNRAKVLFTFWPTETSPALSDLARTLSFGVLFPFMIYGFAISLGDWRRFTLIYLFVLMHLGVYLASWVLIRYRLPVDAVAMPFAALALSDLWSRLQRWRRRRAAA